MSQNLELLSRQRETEMRRSVEARELESEQQREQAAVDEYHHRIRVAVKEYGEKELAFERGCDISTISHQIACVPGRGFPQPWLLRKLRRKISWFAAWEAEDAGYLPPQPKDKALDDTEVISQIEREVLPDLGKRDSQKLLEILRRRRSGR